MVSWKQPVVEEVQNHSFYLLHNQLLITMRTTRYGKSLRAHAPNQTLLENGGRLLFGGTSSWKWLGNFLNAGAHNPAPKGFKYKPLREEKWHDCETTKGISFTKGWVCSIWTSSATGSFQPQSCSWKFQKICFIRWLGWCMLVPVNGFALMPYHFLELSFAGT